MHTHTYTDMPTRTISISEEAYHRLAGVKEEYESFSDIIIKKTGKVDLLDFAGLLTDTEASKIKKRVLEGRQRSRQHVKHFKNIRGISVETY